MNQEILDGLGLGLAPHITAVLIYTCILQLYIAYILILKKNLSVLPKNLIAKVSFT